jgi:hypothetical protein
MKYFYITTDVFNSKDSNFEKRMFVRGCPLLKNSLISKRMSKDIRSLSDHYIPISIGNT